MGCAPGPAGGEGEAAGPPSRDSAWVYLDVFMDPLPVYRARPGAAPVPPSSGLAAQAAPALLSPPSWEWRGFAEEASRLLLLVLLRSGLTPLPSSHLCTQTPVPQGSPILYLFGVN